MSTSIDRSFSTPDSPRALDPLASGYEPASVPDGRLRRLGPAGLRILAWAVAIPLAVVQLLATRHDVNPDGLSYLDLAEQYSRGDWAGAVNTYWSPLYPLLQGLAMRLVQPSPYWEATVAHLVNLAILLGTFAAFDFFLRSLVLAENRTRVGIQAPAVDSTVLATAALGYALMLWGTLRLNSVGLITPDGCVAALVFLAAGIICRIGFAGATGMRFVALGLTLGVGYLAKAVMFPLAPFFIAAGGLAAGSARSGLRGALIALVAFAAVSAPQVAAVSARHGSLTFGESKTWTYASMVNRMTNTAFWSGQAAGAGQPRAAPAILHDDPVVHGYDRLGDETYPFWYDAPRWLGGLEPPVRLGNQVRALMEHARLYADLTLPIGISLLALLLGIRFSRDDSLAMLRSHGPVILPAVVALGMYALVHVEPRYVGPFIVIGALAVFDALRRGSTMAFSGFYQAVTLATGATLVVVTALHISLAIAPAARELIRPRADAHVHWSAAQALASLGVAPGDDIGYIGDSYYAYWARLADVHIVAEMRGDASELWADALKRALVMDAFARGGAARVVADRIPAWATDSLWTRLGTSDLYLYRESH
jgi:hypothetical protein